MFDINIGLTFLHHMNENVWCRKVFHYLFKGQSSFRYKKIIKFMNFFIEKGHNYKYV